MTFGRPSDGSRHPMPTALQLSLSIADAVEERPVNTGFSRNQPRGKSVSFTRKGKIPHIQQWQGRFFSVPTLSGQ
jgi:hypothetical protein